MDKDTTSKSLESRRLDYMFRDDLADRYCGIGFLWLIVVFLSVLLNGWLIVENIKYIFLLGNSEAFPCKIKDDVRPNGGLGTHMMDLYPLIALTVSSAVWFVTFNMRKWYKRSNYITFWIFIVCALICGVISLQYSSEPILSMPIC